MKDTFERPDMSKDSSSPSPRLTSTTNKSPVDGGQDSNLPAIGQGPPNPDSPVDLKSLTLADVARLMAAAHEGDAKAQELTQLFFDQPDHPAWRAVGDLAVVAEQLIASKLFPGKPAHARTVVEEMVKLAAKLTLPGDGPLAKLAIDRVVLACAFANGSDALAAAAGNSALMSLDTAKVQESREKRVQLAFRSLKFARQNERAWRASPY